MQATRTKKAQYLERYASARDGVDPELLASDVGVSVLDVEEWLENDNAFRVSYDRINRRRVDRVLEIFAENAVPIAKNVCDQAMGKGRASVRAAIVVFESLGVKKTEAAFNAVAQNQTIVVQTKDDIAKAKERADELRRILDEA